MQALLLSCLVAAAAGQYTAVRPVVYAAAQPAILRTVPVVRTAPAAAVPVPTYVYQPSQDVLRVQEAAK